MPNSKKNTAADTLGEQMLSIADLDAPTYSRCAVNEDTIQEYKEAVDRGERFPPIVVFFDGKNYWRADGFHRCQASARTGRSHIRADVHRGGLRDALLYSLGANATHGLRRTNADKRRCVGIMLRDPEWSHWSDRRIAQACGVSNTFVGSVRDELSTVDSSEEREGLDGKLRAVPEREREPFHILVAGADLKDRAAKLVHKTIGQWPLHELPNVVPILHDLAEDIANDLADDDCADTDGAPRSEPWNPIAVVVEGDTDDRDENEVHIAVVIDDNEEPGPPALRLVPPVMVDSEAETEAVHWQVTKTIDAIDAARGDLRPLEGALLQLLGRVRQLIAGRFGTN